MYRNKEKNCTQIVNRFWGLNSKNGIIDHGKLNLGIIQSRDICPHPHSYLFQNVKQPESKPFLALTHKNLDLKEWNSIVKFTY